MASAPAPHTTPEPPGDDYFALRSHLEGLIVDAPASGARPALIYVDLDGFSQTEKAHGASVSRGVLRAITLLLEAAVSGRGHAFRLDHDQFAAVLDQTSPEAAVATAEVILERLGQPLEIGDVSVRQPASAAVVMLGHRRRADAVMRDADVTMYRAKTEGGDRVDIYNWESDDWAQSRHKDPEKMAREIEDLRLENQMLSQALLIDLPTGAASGAAFEADLLQADARRQRHSIGYCLLFAEIDCFGGYSDRFGPHAAQEVVKAVANSMKATIRAADRCYRYGAEEYTVILQGAELRDAVAAAERVRASVESLAIENPFSPFGIVTVTLGAVEAQDHHAHRKDVLAEASDMLVEAKLVGHNRVAWPK